MAQMFRHRDQFIEQITVPGVLHPEFSQSEFIIRIAKDPLDSEGLSVTVLVRSGRKSLIGLLEVGPYYSRKEASTALRQFMKDCMMGTLINKYDLDLMGIVDIIVNM
jgi:hypothetical protein